MPSNKQTYRLHVNGRQHNVEADPATPLLYVLRNDLALNGPKYGCGLRQCGACKVLVDGRDEPSCVLPISAVGEQKIVTLAGLATDDGLHPVQQAFLDEQAAQCGYCTSGMIIAAVALLEKNPRPDEAAIRASLHANLCRCGTQSRVLRAIQRAATTR